MSDWNILLRASCSSHLHFLFSHCPHQQLEALNPGIWFSEMKLACKINASDTRPMRILWRYRDLWSECPRYIEKYLQQELFMRPKKRIP